MSECVDPPGRRPADLRLRARRGCVFLRQRKKSPLCNARLLLAGRCTSLALAAMLPRLCRQLVRWLSDI